VKFCVVRSKHSCVQVHNSRNDADIVLQAVEGPLHVVNRSTFLHHMPGAQLSTL
jgi:hypothetical protein